MEERRPYLQLRVPTDGDYQAFLEWKEKQEKELAEDEIARVVIIEM